MVKAFLLKLHTDWSSIYCEEFLDRLASSISDLQTAEDTSSDAETSKGPSTPPSGKIWDSDSSKETFSPPSKTTPLGQRYWYNFNTKEHDSPSQEESLWNPTTWRSPITSPTGLNNLFFFLVWRVGMLSQ